jgi:hypothetical protein
MFLSPTPHVPTSAYSLGHHIRIGKKKLPLVPTRAPCACHCSVMLVLLHHLLTGGLHARRRLARLPCPSPPHRRPPRADVALLVGVLDWQTYQGGTRGSRLCGGDRDRETENSKVCARTRDTRFIQVRVAKVANPTSCLEIKYGALRLVLVEIRCPARYPAVLYIVQGVGS